MVAYGEYLASTGHPEQAIALGDKALAIDPLSAEINSFLPWDYYLEREYDRCLSLSEKNMKMFPADFWVPWPMTAGMCHCTSKGNIPRRSQNFRNRRR